MLIFRQLFDATSSTYTYLLGDGDAGVALLIDPVYEHERRDRALLRELGLRLLATLDTHVHADHVTAAWLHQQRCGSRILLSEHARAAHVDQPLRHGDRVDFGSRSLEVRATPGHTDGCLSFVLDDHSMAFTGDSLLIRGCGRTDFQQGSPQTLYRSVREQIFSLPGSCLLYPGHDYRGLTATSVAEERRYNPRLGGDVGVDDFAGYMNNLGLPHPRLMDVAVPANLRCGQPQPGAGLPPEPAWAPLTYTFGGIWEIEPVVLQETISGPQTAGIQIIDVREASEFDAKPDGPAGDEWLRPIPGARLIPLSDLPSRLGEIDLQRPVVAVCRSGARSAQAVVLLQKAGCSQAANLAGGLLRWRAEA